MGAVRPIRNDELVTGLEHLGMRDARDVGAKAASLAEAARLLVGQGPRVPDGFVTTASAYDAFMATTVPACAWRDLPPAGRWLLRRTRGRGSLGDVLGILFDARSYADEPLAPATVDEIARALCAATPLPDGVSSALRRAYHELDRSGEGPVDVAVRPSTRGTARPAAYSDRAARSPRDGRSFLNVRGFDALAEAWRRCVGGVCAERRDGDPVPILVTRMVRSDMACAGSVATVDPASGNRNVIVLESSYGLGEPAVRGGISPDRLMVWKRSLRRGECAIVHRALGGKARKVVYATGGERTTQSVEVLPADRRAWSVSDREVAALARTALALEERFGRPVELRWAKDGGSGDLFAVGARLTSAAGAHGGDREGVRSFGPVRGAPLALDGASAPDSGSLAFGGPRVSVRIDTSSPERALHDAMLPADGVGSVRLGRLLASEVGVHPLLLAHAEALEAFARDGSVAAELRPLEHRLLEAGRASVQRVLATAAQRLRVDRPGGEHLVERLRDAVARVCAAFHPRPVAVSLSDLTSRERRDLVGGVLFEPTEENPAIALRGASRLVDPRFGPALELECRALRLVRHDLGLDNLEVLVPFCRTPAEGQALAARLAEHGLSPAAGVPLHLLIELPSNVVVADDFVDVMGLSGGVVGVDSLVRTIYALSDGDLRDESGRPGIASPSVGTMIAAASERFQARGLAIGICGWTAARDGSLDEACAFLAEHGIAWISVPPDSIPALHRALSRLEVRETPVEAGFVGVAESVAGDLRGESGDRARPEVA